ncbi:MAG TPA: hypothetical protein VM328_10315 [Fimbriimonadaceae bacterium]|nr:hypothetical protein [Fimbriimonadaceae bacterium]
MRRALVLLTLSVPLLAWAQAPDPNSIIQVLQARSVGPNTMGGRISDLAVYEKEPRIFYAATASGGLFKTTNGGMTLQPVFERESTISMGAVAVDQSNPDLVWVGTGEASSRNSTAWGDGVYKSTDGGKSWMNVGLRDTRHISKIIIHPKNPDIVYVGGLGHLWGTNQERGLFKTTDGGKTWTKLLYVDDRTGVIDMAMDPTNPDTMLVAMWSRMRTPYSWESGGEGSGLYKTTNGGRDWRKVHKGIPMDKGMILGRIGLSMHLKNPNIVIASVELGKGSGQQRVTESGIYKSTDKGESWVKINSLNPRPFYFSMPRIDPVDPDRIYLPAVQFHYSSDGGKTFQTMRTNVHVDHHALWINPNDNNHMIQGNDGGVAQTRDRGATWEFINGMAIGQFYGIHFDMRKPYYVYGGLQDNGSWGGPTQTARGGVAFWDYFNIAGGDGFHVQIDPNDWTTAYAESQQGFVQRVDVKNGGGRTIRPPAQQGETLRFNWSTPIVLSPHNSRTVYVGAQFLFRSVDRGNNWRRISPDLTTNDPKKWRVQLGATPEATGAENHCTIITISESPRRPGIIWVGTDDGQLHVTRNDGAEWTNVVDKVPSLPRNTWVSRVTASRYADGRAYATFDGHRTNDYKPYVFVTQDYGQTWTSISAGLPDGDVTYVIKEGEKNEDLLFLGTEMGLWISLDRGKTWTKFKSNFPTVSVHDVAVHPRDMDLVIGTHGRSIWTLPIAALEDLDTAALAKDVVLTKPAPLYQLGRVSRPSSQGDRLWMAPNSQPSTLIAYYLKTAGTGEARITIEDASGAKADLTGTVRAGLNTVNWNGRLGQRVAAPGEYRVTLQVGGSTYTSSVTVDEATDIK